MVETTEEVQKVAVEYFTTLFLAQDPNNMALDEVLSTTKRVVTDDMNNRLTSAFTQEEVRDALFQMYPRTIKW